MSRILSLIVILVLTSSCDKNKIIYVASSLADCQNSSEKCLQVKENQEDEWTVLNNDIEGFEHKDGFLQKIEVKISKIKNPASGGSVFNYKFVKLIYEQEQKDTTKIEDVPFSVVLDKNHSGKWQINHIVGIDSLNTQPTLIFKDGGVYGNAGCNNYNASFSLGQATNDISFSLTMMTKKLCPNMAVEDAYFECLSKAKTYKLADKLTIYDANNIELMSCSRMKD